MHICTFVSKLFFPFVSQKLLLLALPLDLEVIDQHLKQFAHRDVVVFGDLSQNIHVFLMSPDIKLAFVWISLVWHFLAFVQMLPQTNRCASTHCQHLCTRSSKLFLRDI